MKPADFRLLFTALGFTAVVMRGEKIPKKEAAQRAAVFAGLIEEFCRENVPEAFEANNENIPAAVRDGKLAAAEKLAHIIVEIIEEKGGCLPRDLIAQGFSSDEVDRHWAMARALAHVELNKQEMNS